MTCSPEGGTSHNLKHPTYNTDLSVRPRHFLRGETHDPCGSETGSGPCPAGWPNALPRSGLRGNPMLFFHEPDRGSSGRYPLALALVSQTVAISGRGDCIAPRVCTEVTSTLPVLTVLAASVFRSDATALSFATVRWRGVRTHTRWAHSSVPLSGLGTTQIPGLL